jgi:GrpB-like predicted nucleotidyltransferase (UPF0157 family)/GNAT superfamily N-acetyltransferase
MSIKKKHIEVVPYNLDWPKMYENEAVNIKKVLGDSCIAVYHIGSTSIPGLAAKEDIDILCVVKELQSALILQNIDYVFKGELNIPLRYFFSKNTIDFKINMHVTEKDHGFVNLNLSFCKYLKTHPHTRQAYQELKYRLLQDPMSFERINGGFPKYTLEKNEFIKGVLNQAGYTGITFNFCMHYAEWEAAKHYRQTYFFDKVPVADPYIWTFNHPDHAHFILYQGSEIIGYAHIQLWLENRAALRIIVVEPAKRNQEFGGQFLLLIEKWLKVQGYRSIHIESSPETLHFYKKHDYVAMPFCDPDGHEGHPNDVAIGKIL